jgi:formylglycine-generating enzyme required for sulfatase activity
MGNAGNQRRRDSSTLDIEWPRHYVTVRSFAIGKYEVTQGQYFEVTGIKPASHMKNPDDASQDGWMKLPVESISWYDTLVFCNQLSIKEKLKPVYSIDGSVDPDVWGDPPTRRSTAWDAVGMDINADGYRLPTEAEWEYAARGGVESKNYLYAGSDTPSQVAWYTPVNSRAVITIHEVGKKQPNELGLYDMSGNVMEWCWDWLDTYSEDHQNNPIGPSRGLYRVIRGGGWSIRDNYSRITYRHNNQAHYFGINLGFRVARNIKE